ncbi:MAG TPA: aldose 1-epimerase family protein [Jatrophihabitantaceae bacterium]|jgi:aldose 1-epimerase
MALTGRQYAIAAGEFEATVVEVGAALRSFTHLAADVTASFGEDELPPRCCGGVLVPWPNRIRGGRYRFEGEDYQLPLTEPARGNAIHGLARWTRWSCVRHDADAVTLAYDIPPQTGWPFQVMVELTYRLDVESGLAVTATARNLGVGRAPFGAGFHPYLAVDAGGLSEVSLQLPASQMFVTDDAQVPIGVRPVDRAHDFRRKRRLGATRMDAGFTDLDTVDGRGHALVHSGSGGARIWFDETFGYLQVFTPDVLSHGRPAIAVEPMTCAPDAFNTGAGLIVLEPGGSWTGSWGITPAARA